jgi:hypothetical protein
MPDNTNVNNNAAVVVVGRTAPVPPGQQKSQKSIPVVIASDQSTIPVAEQNKIQSEVALSLLGIPRSEVALGIFADVNTYDVNPTEWSATPEQYATVPNTGIYAGISETMGWGLTHVPEESGALIEAPADRSAVLTSKRFFRYQPGRVSSATFGVKTTLIDDDGSSIQNPCVRKYGIFDNYDGYYWESRNDGEGDNFCVVRRTQSIIYENPLEFGVQQTEDYGRTNPSDPLSSRGSESESNETAQNNPVAVPKKFGDLVILRDDLLMTHAAVYDPTLLQDESQVGITSIFGGNTLSISGLGKTITNATYDINSGLMVVTTSAPHGFAEGKFISLSGIGMTCYLNPTTPISYPNRTYGYNVLQVNSANSFVVNIGISTVPTTYTSGGMAVGLSTGQFVSYSKGTNANALTGLIDTAIYKVSSVSVNATTGLGSVALSNLDETSVTLSNVTGISSHVLITPVPFVQPVTGNVINNSRTKYTTIKPTGMFPYMYKVDGTEEGYIDTTLKTTSILTLKSQIDDVNDYYDKWVNQNVKKQYWNVYEYRIPRSRFSGDRLDAQTDNLLYSDAVSDKRSGEFVIDESSGEIITDTSIWDLDLTKVTMYKIEFSWYGAVGALFLAYVPVSNGEARWVRVHHLRASNQLKVSSLGNATLPITYLVYGGGNPNRNGYPNATRPQSSFSYGSSSEHIVKYGASYYIDGGDRGTVKLFSYSTPTSQSVYGSKRTFSVNNGGGVGIASTQVDLSNATSVTEPYIIGSVPMCSSFYVGSKVITSNPLDQNIEISFVDISSQSIYLNAPLNSTSLSSILVIPNRPLSLIGIKCKDFIRSSTGKDVRNRTQVYPTRLSSGSTGVVKLDLIKSPIFQTTTTTTGSLALTSEVDIGKRGKPTQINVNNSSYLPTGGGIYGYFRGYYKNDASEKPITVLGYLENKGSTLGGYYFYSLDSTSDEIILINTKNFLKEENTNSVGTNVSAENVEFSLAQLSSVKINPQIRSPIPNTGTVVSSIFVPASGAEYDLSPYFDYNKEYLSFPLTDKVESLYLCASTQTNYNSLVPSADISASITWEEQ